MKRIPFSEVIKNTSIDPRKEFDRLYELFYVQNISKYLTKPITIHNCCEECFISYPFRGTCISLEDFDKEHHYCFEKINHYIKNVNSNIDLLISFCDYSFNLVLHCQKQIHSTGISFFIKSVAYIQQYLEQVLKVAEKMGYMQNSVAGVIEFVPKDQAAISVAEIVDSNLSYKTIEYNHNSMKGDLDRKKAILLALADKLEPQREKLKQINFSLESDLFFLFNSINLRHNNVDLDGKNYIHYVSSMKNEEIECWYDDTYQMCLLAFLELDHVDRKNRIHQLKKDIQKKDI